MHQGNHSSKGFIPSVVCVTKCDCVALIMRRLLCHGEAVSLIMHHTMKDVGGVEV